MRFSDGSFSFKLPNLAGITIDSNDNPFVVDGDHIAILDRTAFANADRSGLAVMRGVDQAIIGELGDVSAQPHTGVWTAGFGGFTDLSGGRDVFDAEQTLGGGLAGVTVGAGPGLALGLFGGAARTVYSSQYDSEHIETNYGLAGGFGRYTVSQLVADFSVTAGWSSAEGRREIASNMRGFRDYEPANSDTDGWIVAPTAGLGWRVPLVEGGIMVPALKVRGQLAHLNGYGESGSTANARVEARDLDDVEERLELGFYQTIPATEWGATSVHARIGVSELERVGDRNVHATLLGSPIDFASGLSKTETGGYVGFGFDAALVPGVSLFGDTEVELSERSHAAGGTFGFSAKF